MNRHQVYLTAERFQTHLLRFLAARGLSGTKEAKLLVSEAQGLCRSIASWSPDANRARAARQAKAAEREANEPFLLVDQHSGQVEKVVGWPALAKRMGLQVNTLKSRMSAGKGKTERELYDKKTMRSNSIVAHRVNYKRKLTLEEHTEREHLWMEAQKTEDLARNMPQHETSTNRESPSSGEDGQADA